MLTALVTTSAPYLYHRLPLLITMSITRLIRLSTNHAQHSSTGFPATFCSFSPTSLHYILVNRHLSRKRPKIPFWQEQLREVDISIIIIPYQMSSFRLLTTPQIAAIAVTFGAQLDPQKPCHDTNLHDVKCPVNPKINGRN